MNFDHVDSATSADDRRSLLAVQEAARGLGGYCYLEIGSDLGGTIQPHIADPLCERIYSIDKRSAEQPDERGRLYQYPENSTCRMIEALSKIPEADLSKLKTFDGDASEVSIREIVPAPDYCFIDAEHTDIAIQSDFRFCESVSEGRPVVLAHDAFIVYRGLDAIINRLMGNAKFVRVLFLPTNLMLIDTVGRISGHPLVIARALEAWRGYLDGMLRNDWYRQEFLKLCVDRQAIPV